MELSLTFVVAEGLADELIVAFYDRFDGNIGSTSGRTVVTVRCVGADPVTAARDTVAALEKLGFTVTGVDLDLVNITEIADRLGGRTRQSVRQLVTGERGPGSFPPHLGCPGGVRVWDWGSVNAWLRANLGAGDDEQPLAWPDAAAVQAWLGTRKVAYR